MRFALGCLVLLSPSWVAADIAAPHCPNATLFDNSDAAFHVLVGQRHAPPAGQGAPGKVRVEQVLRGPQVDVARYQGQIGPNQRVLLFLNRDGTPVACSTRTLPAGATGQQWIATLARFNAARGARAQAALLAEVATGSGGFLADQAGLRLVRDPTLARALTTQHDRDLIAALPTVTGFRQVLLALLLARRHVVEAVPVLVELMPNAPSLIHSALELLTNHHDPDYVHNAAIEPAAVPVFQQRWRDWFAAHQGRSAAQVVRVGYRERGVTPPATRGAHIRLVRRGPDRLTRAVALTACERRHDPVQSVSITEYVSFDGDSFRWEMLAAQCVAHASP